MDALYRLDDLLFPMPVAHAAIDIADEIAGRRAGDAQAEIVRMEGQQFTPAIVQLQARVGGNGQAVFSGPGELQGSEAVWGGLGVKGDAHIKSGT